MIRIVEFNVNKEKSGKSISENFNNRLLQFVATKHHQTFTPPSTQQYLADTRFEMKSVYEKSHTVEIFNYVITN